MNVSTTYKSTPPKFCRLDSTRLFMSNLKNYVMATVTNTRSLADFKAETGITTLNIYRSKKDKLYALDGDKNFIAMVATDLDRSRDINVLDVVDDETSESWKFICNPKEVVFTI